jgi:hypothetical protein
VQNKEHGEKSGKSVFVCFLGLGQGLSWEEIETKVQMAGVCLEQHRAVTEAIEERRAAPHGTVTSNVNSMTQTRLLPKG